MSLVNLPGLLNAETKVVTVCLRMTKYNKFLWYLSFNIVLLNYEKYGTVSINVDLFPYETRLIWYWDPHWYLAKTLLLAYLKKIRFCRICKVFLGLPFLGLARARGAYLLTKRAFFCYKKGRQTGFSMNAHFPCVHVQLKKGCLITLKGIIFT